jgi:PKD repeat protein
MRKVRFVVAIAGMTFFAACADSTTMPLDQSFEAIDAAAYSVVNADEYIVVFRNNVTDVRAMASRLSGDHGGELGYVYEHAVRGFSVRLPAQAAAALARNPNVAYIEADQVMTIAVTQTNATWGIDRIDQRDLPLSGTYTYDATGAGVRTYIIDTGIRNSHQDFGGRASSGYTAINDGRGTDDCNGHGTHVAGTVGGTVYGVAKQTALIAVRVLNCQGSGTTSGVIAGVDWVTANHIKPAVANMSLGGGASTTLDNAVANSIAAGVTYAVAAGNSNANACNYSPARVASAITVGATTSSDARASYSNYGSCLDLFAPGSSIKSAWYTSNTATNTISGTSMASPHVAGVAALVLQGSPTASPASVTSAITSNATTGKVTSAGSGSVNRLLYMGFTGGGTGNTPPTASFTFNCSGLTCSFDGSASSDPGGSITGYAWNFGDGTTDTGVTTSHAYASSGTRTVTLTVTDNGGATGSTSKSVSVTAPGGSTINLSVSTTKQQGVNYANLSWSGTSGSTDVFRNDVKIATVSNTTYVDNLGRGSGSRTYKVCNAGTTTCSSDVVASY